MDALPTLRFFEKGTLANHLSAGYRLLYSCSLSATALRKGSARPFSPSVRFSHMLRRFKPATYIKAESWPLVRTPASGQVRSLPNDLSKEESQRPKASCDYILTGTLVQQDGFEYAFKAKSWEKVPNSWSLAELRREAKQNNPLSFFEISFRMRKQLYFLNCFVYRGNRGSISSI